MKEEFIRLEHISKKFGDDLVLKDIDAKLCKGEILGFLGPSGKGDRLQKYIKKYM